MGEFAIALEEGFVEPSEENLEGIGPGCFALKKDFSGFYCWVEIVSIVEDGYQCIAHPALISIVNEKNISEGDQIFLKREQITALGCERYCSC